MLNTTLKITSLIVSLFFAGEITFAQELTSEVSLFKVEINDEGKEELGEAEFIAPNDLVEYQLTYTNNGTSEITLLQPVLPIPEGFQLFVKREERSTFKPIVSVDGALFSAYPMIKAINGDTKPIFIPFEDHEYRFLKWNIERLAAGETIVLKARMNVL